MSVDKGRVEALNVDGGFFQRRCAQEFRGAKSWKVLAEEYPTEATSSTGRTRDETAIDILAGGASSWRRACLSVECKKADPFFKEWIFFRKHGSHHRFRNLAVEDKPNQRRVAIHLLEGNLSEVVCDYGRELTGRYGERDRDRTKTPSDRIQNAARQAVLGTRGVALGIANILYTPRENTMAWAHGEKALHLVPMVITTAKLYVCSFSPDDVALDAGSLAHEKAAFEEHSYVIYEHPLTGGLKFDPELVSRSPDDLDALTKAHVIVLQAQSLPELVQKYTPLARLIEGW